MQKIVKSNNEKYMSKMVNTETKVGRVLTDTESLINLYNKKIQKIGKDVTKTSQIKSDIGMRMDRAEDRLKAVDQMAM